MFNIRGGEGDRSSKGGSEGAGVVSPLELIEMGRGGNGDYKGRIFDMTMFFPINKIYVDTTFAANRGSYNARIDEFPSLC